MKTPRERQIERFLARLELTGDALLHDIEAGRRGQLRVALTVVSPFGTLDPDDLVRPDYPGYHDAAPQDWTPASRASISNASQVEFGVCDGAATIVGFAAYNVERGVVIASGFIDPPLVVSAGMTPMFATGALTVTLP